MRKQRKKFLCIVLMIMTICCLSGCGTKKFADGEYTADVTLEGGSGRASVESPAQIHIKDGQIYATIVFSSANYDYMIVNEEKYTNENTEGNSTFTIPISGFEMQVPVIANTTAMSQPHEIEYTLYFEAVQEKEVSQIDFETLAPTGQIELIYAEQFSIEEYGVYDLITIVDGGRFLLVPEFETVPSNLPEDVVVLQQPLDCTYLVSTSAMDLIRAVGGISNIRLSGTKEDGWYIEEAIEAMQKGELLYAGKYNAPDYELILEEGCNLAVENTMIYHNPEVKEKLEELGIPVLVERSSYESHPLGRLEWMKLYGTLFEQEEEANAFYQEQLEKTELIMEKENTQQSVAFFYMTSNGAVNVRKPNDYIAQMIQLSGGNYVLEGVLEENENALSTMNMQMEDFYAAARDADILIYNSTIDGELQSLDELLQINALFKDFKAVKEGKVYCTSNNFFQQMTGIGNFMEDLNKVFTGSSAEEYTYLKKLR